MTCEIGEPDVVPRAMENADGDGKLFPPAHPAKTAMARSAHVFRISATIRAGHYESMVKRRSL